MKNTTIILWAIMGVVIPITVWAVYRYRKNEQRKCPVCGHWRERRHEIDRLCGRRCKTRTGDYCHHCDVYTLFSFDDDREFSFWSYLWRKLIHTKQFLPDGMLSVYGGCVNDLGVGIGSTAQKGFNAVMKLFQGRLEERARRMGRFIH